MLTLKKREKLVAANVFIVFALLVAVFGFSRSSIFVSAAYEKYDYNAEIFYDPVNGGTACNENNYWTPYYQNTTCYRWFLVLDNDSTADATLKVILDHDIGRSTFAEKEAVLAQNTSNWNDYDGTVTILSENEIAEAMKLGDDRPTTDPDHISISNGINFRLMTNSLYYINGTSTNTFGFWSSDLYPGDTNYAYTVTQTAANRLVGVEGNRRGVRPVIEIAKSKVNSKSGVQDITHALASGTLYSYPQATAGEITYKQLQGFTVTDNKLIFASSNDATPNDSMLFAYSGENFDFPEARTPRVEPIGHGNDMTFNSKTNQIVITGLDDYQNLWITDDATLQDSSTVNFNEKNGFNISSIGYDYVNDEYVSNSGRRGVTMDTEFNVKNMFSFTFDEISQNLEYHNGFAYHTLYVGTCPADRYIYCTYQYRAGLIDVYNVKLNSDGTPGNNFGRKVARFYLDGDGIGELESISFRNNKAYIGYASWPFGTDNAFRIYSIDDSLLAIPLETQIEYVDTSTSTTVKISSMDQLAAVAGYTLSDDGHTLTKTVTGAEAQTVSDSIFVCDNYGNCTGVSYTHTNDKITEKTFTLTFDINEGVGRIENQQCTTYEASCTVTIPDITPERDDYTFLGWADTNTATEATYTQGQTVTLSADKTVYAVWKQNKPTPEPDPDPEPEPEPTPDVPDTGEVTEGNPDGTTSATIVSGVVFLGLGIALYRWKRSKEHFVFDK